MDRFSLVGKVAVVTGGANGLGRAYGRAFDEAGARVAVVDLDQESGESFASELREAAFLQADITDRRQVSALMDAVVGRLGGLDILVNNAGGWSFHNAEQPDDDWERLLKLNLTGTMIGCQEAGRRMIAQGGGGSIINISSVSSLIVNPPVKEYLDTAYFASKAGVNHLTRSLADQWARHGIRVNAIAPGYMDKSGSFSPEAPRPKWLDNVPLDRPGRPDELGSTAVFLASDASSYITGQIIQVDGGYTLR